MYTQIGYYNNMPNECPNWAHINKPNVCPIWVLLGHTQCMPKVCIINHAQCIHIVCTIFHAQCVMPNRVPNLVGMKLGIHAQSCPMWYWACLVHGYTYIVHNHAQFVHTVGIHCNNWA